MNWQHFQTYNEAPTRAFEAMCNQLFELWVNKEYKNNKESFVVVNGAGGDGGVESYATLTSGEEIGVQAKWFLENITANQFDQIGKSIITALKVHKNLIKYIVCVPRDLSNIKIGKNNKPVTNTEYSKWNGIVEEIKKGYPEVEIVLWGDHELTGKLQYAEASGVRRYWFEKEEITKEAIQYSFDKQKNGWLDQRYISDLHNQGTIYKKINSFLGDSEECTELLREIDYIEEAYRKLIKYIDALCELLNVKNKDIDKIGQLQELIKRVKKQLSLLSKVKKDFRYENKLIQWTEEIFSYDEIEEIEKWIDKESHGDYRSHFNDVAKLLSEVRNINIHDLYIRLNHRIAFGKIIITGNQGTGKTHGIANEVEEQLSKNYHIPILIQAKSVSLQDEWRDIIVRVLGLSQNWSEEEIWSALEAISYRNEVSYPMHDLNERNVRIVPKVLLCIDGIDETRPYTRWNERIREVNTITAFHERIKFCFTGRPYAFERKKTMFNHDYMRVYLSDVGDVSVKTIYDDYINHFNVNDEGVKWLRHTIRTPYTLKLLCEIYSGKRIESIGKSDVTISNLLQKKFEMLNEEFKILAGFEENISDEIVKIVLLKINELFESCTEVTRTNLKNVLRELEIYSYLKEKGLEEIINFLEKHSFLQSYEKHAEDVFDIGETIYMLGAQHVYDYLKALRLFKKAKYSDKLELDRQVLDNMGALQIYSVMIMECYGEMLWNNQFCKKNIYDEDLFSAVAFALVNVDVNISSKYEDWVFEIMKQNAFALSHTINKIVLPLAREENHPLGSKLLDKCLLQFDKPADRDVIWSIPSGLGGNDEASWIRYEDIEYSNETYRLEVTDYFDGMPLIWAWGLTSVDNTQRVMIRKELTRWAIMQPEEFFELFEHFANVNDIQLKTDMFAIAMAVTHVCRKKRIFVKRMSKWIYRNIFQYGKIVNIHNAAIRYYSRAIMECAFSEGIITNSQIDKCRPPYRTGSSLIAFAPEAAEATRMGGYKMMDYDLARYVLCDPLDRRFLGNQKFKTDIQKIVKKYARKYCLPDLSTEQFVLASAFGYVMDAGWREDVFYGVPNGGQPGEKIGLDVAICRTYRPATHGSMSSVMTITEKYTWCAKMELLGYLADRLPYHEYGVDERYVEDYGKLEDYVNPYQECCQVDVEKLMQDTEWILPEDLTPSIKEYAYSKEGVCEWIKKSSIPNFNKWINIRKGYVTLYASHHITNEDQGVTTMMWISSGLISKGKISSFTRALKNKDFAVDFVNASEIAAYPEADFYISPMEVCWYDWKKEHDSETLYGKNVFYKNIAKCICEMQGNGEINYEMPSKKIRDIMGIVNGDGYHYYDKNNCEVAYYTEAGECYGDSQHMLLVDENIFCNNVSKLELQPIWIIRVLKEASIKAREKFDFYKDKDETYLVWKNNQRWQARRIEWEE